MDVQIDKRTTRPKPSAAERFAAVVATRTRRTETGCLEWTGGTHKQGYGILGARGKNSLTHRLAWEVSNGRQLLSGECVCHRCDNPPCVNPEHLFLGSHADNMRDMFAKGRANRATGLRNRNKSRWLNVAAAKWLLQIGMNQWDAAEATGVSRRTTWTLANSNHWSDQP